MGIFIERKFTDSSDKIIVLRLMIPEKEKKRWKCDYEIIDSDVIYKSYAAGYDSMDALFCAITKSKLYITNEQSLKNRSFYWIEKNDLGLSLLF
jgi:hypothetical protein